MQKSFLGLIAALSLTLCSCHSAKNRDNPLKNSAADAPFIFPVTDFLKGQLRQIDSMPVTPLKIISLNGKSDSTWQKRKDIRPAAAPFLSPLIDSASMSQFFSVKSFLDQTLNEITFTYSLKKKLPDSIKLTHWDVYINPQTNNVDRIYLVKEETENEVNITTQLTWVTHKWYSIRTITQAPGRKPEVREEKMIWDFDD